eukprot:14764452-Alexandrium_andersonii.AAC.1
MAYLEAFLDGSVRPSAEPPPGLAPGSLRQVRVKIAQALGPPDPGPEEGLKATLVDPFARVAGGPDGDLAGWLREGAPLG